MSFITKPEVSHPKLRRNALGLTIRDYEGGLSTLCAGCGHDSISAAIVQSFYELEIPPHRVAKLSGIGCSSKTPTYFLRQAHGFNAVHGRMPAVATGANAANGDLYYIGISGDGDSLSIGIGQFVHAIRRNVNMLYIIENNGVYGLTKGQFSASADVGSKAKRGEINELAPIDPIMLAITLGGSFAARSFSGDKGQLVPLIKAGLLHEGFALLDVISPCVTFNDHEGSTKSYAHTREHAHTSVYADFVPPSRAIETAYPDGQARTVRLHDGSSVVLRKVDQDYDPTDRSGAFRYLQERAGKGEIVTGLLYIDGKAADVHAAARTIPGPLGDLPYDALCPGPAALDRIQQGWR